MKVLFAKISSMKYYKGITEDDKPKYGGQYVKETGYAHEEYNFQSETEPDGSSKCYGFFELKSNRGLRNQLHIEKIHGCEEQKFASKVDDVLVIFCALRDKNMPRIVGWYKHATVYRDYQEKDFDGYVQAYNVLADAKDVVLIPWQKRGLLEWEVPTAKKDGYGFGQSMQWYATELEAQDYLVKIIDKINSYQGPNDLEKFE